MSWDSHRSTWRISDEDGPLERPYCPQCEGETTATFHRLEDQQ